ncbi:MAG: hypothetical protein RIS22_78 [Actinomycetota bacterium]|jgi:hypothetical protein
MHESGNSHKFKAEALKKKKREDQFHGARSEKELQQQLAEIEKAANAALATDRINAIKSNNFGQIFNIKVIMFNTSDTVRNPNLL